MFQAIWEIIISLEVIIIFVLLLTLAIILDPLIRLSKTKKKQKIRKIPTPIEEEAQDTPGKILVPDSTYELLMEDKERKNQKDS